MTAVCSPVMICPNGHGSATSPGNRFCTLCGAALVAVNTAPPPVYAAPGAPIFQAVPIAVAPMPAPPCPCCGGDGSRLAQDLVVCPQCRWLQPLAPGYSVDPSAFQWAQDSAAMAKLRAFAPLHAFARSVSDKAGRRWVETSFNAVRLGENQLPALYAQAVRAARLLGMPAMPDVYICGDRMWEAATYGSDNSAFIILGTALVNNFRDEDLLFLLAREMGHCRAGHALWKTVGTFLLGQQGPRKGMMDKGLVGLLNPDKLVEGALEVPLMAWARQAEITADRAGLLAVGSEEIARRVLLAWSLRSVPLYKQISIEAWLQQQEDGEDQMTRLAEAVSSPTPFITRRLKLMDAFACSPELARIRAVIAPLDRQASPVSRPETPPEARSSQTPLAASAAHSPEQTGTSAGPAPLPTVDSEYLHLACPTCRTPMRVPNTVLQDRDRIDVRCPNAQCGRILTLQRRPRPLTLATASAAAALQEGMTDDE
ncbi:MAG TPA: M48 family metallopeptidase [Chthonomonadaceae bacterium]|nr:M48 family metallopeptidase [Chthonomonadaceae bacterium]